MSRANSTSLLFFQVSLFEIYFLKLSFTKLFVIVGCLFLKFGSNSLLVSPSWFMQIITEISIYSTIPIFESKKLQIMFVKMKLPHNVLVMLVVRIKSSMLVVYQFHFGLTRLVNGTHVQLHMSSRIYYRLATCFIKQN